MSTWRTTCSIGLFLLLLEVSALADQREIPVITGSGFSAVQYGEVAGLADVGQLFLRGSFASSSVADLRREVLASGLGSVRFFYPAGLKSVLNRDPLLFVKETLQSAEAAAAALGIPESSAASPPLNIVVLSSVPEAANRGLLSSSVCHSAWTGPPANIVIAADRIKGKCGRVRGSDPAESFREALIHELGHVLEFRLLQQAYSRRSRWHGEGFAMWFESEVQRRAGRGASEKKARAREIFSLQWQDYMFRGTAADYLQSYARVAAIAQSSPQPLLDVYRTMNERGCTFSKAVELQLGWTPALWAQHSSGFLEESVQTAQ